MSMTWLADVERDTFWAHFAWPEFGASNFDEHALAILPVYGMGDHGLGLPLDAEEILGSTLLRRALYRAKALGKIRMLPPVRFALAPYPSGVFGIDPETAHDLLLEIAEGVKAAGIQKLLLLTTSPWNVEFIDAASRDIRVTLGIQTFVTTTAGVGLSFHPASEDRGRTQAAVAKILGETPRPSSRAPWVIDPSFRPGNFRSPPTLPPGPPLDGVSFVSDAGEKLSQLLLEIVARPSLAGGQKKTDLVLGTSPDDEIAEEVPIFPHGFRSRYLPAMSRDDWDKIPNRADAWVIIPTGSIEQHGPHLPVGVDAMLGHMWVAQMLKKFPVGAPIFVAPPITYGKSNEHLGFPGTVSISGKTLRRLLLAIAAQLKSAGFRQIAILNSHGGNTSVLAYTVREIQSTLEMRAGILGQPYKPPLSPQEAEFGFHAGEWETSLMLLIASDLVHMEKAVSEYPLRGDTAGMVRLDNASAYLSWMTADISESGVMGDAKSATLQKGERWAEAGAAALAQKLSNLESR